MHYVSQTNKHFTQGLIGNVMALIIVIVAPRSYNKDTITHKIACLWMSKKILSCLHPSCSRIMLTDQIALPRWRNVRAADVSIAGDSTHKLNFIVSIMQFATATHTTGHTPTSNDRLSIRVVLNVETDAIHRCSSTHYCLTGARLPLQSTFKLVLRWCNILTCLFIH